MPAEIDWRRLGLSANPFENVLPGEGLEWVDWPPGLAARLGASRFAIQLVGPHKGAGKSTVLRACQARLDETGRRTHFVYVPPTARWRAPLPDDTEVLLVDEANRLSWMGWRRVRRFRKRGGALLLATHVPAPLGDLENLRARAARAARLDREALRRPRLGPPAAGAGATFAPGGARGRRREPPDPTHPL